VTELDAAEAACFVDDAHADAFGQRGFAVERDVARVEKACGRCDDDPFAKMEARVASRPSEDCGDQHEPARDRAGGRGGDACAARGGEPASDDRDGERTGEDRGEDCPYVFGKELDDRATKRKAVLDLDRVSGARSTPRNFGANDRERILRVAREGLSRVSSRASSNPCAARPRSPGCSEPARARAA